MAQAEYTLWFDVLLKGLSRLRLPVPLGGTSLFVKTSAVRAVDGWDANNVTEDADLGLRLARRGWRAEVIDSTTWEEPPVKLDQWTGQRSRWIKGFMVTWLVHMRSPRALIRDLGGRNALAINIMLLDGFVAFLLQPLFWVAILAWLVFGATPWSGLVNPAMAAAIMLTFALGQGFIWLAAFTALRRRFGFSRAVWAPGLWVYWQFATRAAYRALWEMFGSKTSWTKTEHGLSKAAQHRQQEALKRR
jgi:cellulose synthase/poly-beta-1,6-N-acetylglucosamine synthase-like glycosyltransferase